MTASNFKKLMTIKAIATLFFGVCVVLVPAHFFSIFGIILTPGGILIARLYGAALLIFGLQLYFTRNAVISRDLSNSMLATSIGDIIAVIVTLSGQFAGIMNSLGWLLVGIYILSAILFTYFFFDTVLKVRQG